MKRRVIKTHKRFLVSYSYSDKNRKAQGNGHFNFIVYGRNPLLNYSKAIETIKKETNFNIVIIISICEVEV